MSRETVTSDEFARSHWREATQEEFARLWEAEYARVPEFSESEFHIITGLLLPIWDRLPAENMRVYRFETDRACPRACQGQETGRSTARRALQAQRPHARALPIGAVVFPGSGISANLADKAKKLGIPRCGARRGRCRLGTHAAASTRRCRLSHFPTFPLSHFRYFPLSGIPGQFAERSRASPFLTIARLSGIMAQAP